MTTTQRQRKPRLRMTERDHEAMELLAALRAIRLDDLGRLLAHLGERHEPMTVRSARRIVQRWQLLGLAAAEPNPRGGLGIITSTRDTSRERLPHGLPAWRDLPHTLTTAAVAVQLLTATGGTWTSDSQLQGAEGHRPDGVLTTTDGGSFAVEVERTTKSGSRWARIIPETVARYGRVLYLADEDTARHLDEWARTHLTPHDRQALSIKRLGGLAR